MNAAEALAFPCDQGMLMVSGEVVKEGKAKRKAGALPASGAW